MGLSIFLEQMGNKRILRLKGDLNGKTLPSLKEALNTLFKTHHRHLILDLAQMTQLSPEGVQMLVEKTREFIGGQGNLALIHIPKDVMKWIQMAGIDRFLLIYRDEQEALRTMG